MMKHSLEKTGMVTVTGGQIHYRYYEPHNPGKSKKTPVVFLHGGPGSSHATMYACLLEIADERPAIFYDQLGSYFSPAKLTPDLMTVERFADEIDCLMSELGLEKIILLGHSWGGSVAAHYAVHNPQKLEALILSCPLLSTARWIEDCNRLLAELPEDVQQTIRICEANGTTDGQEYEAANDLFASRHFIRSQDHIEIYKKNSAKQSRDIYAAMWGPSEFSCHGLLKDFDIFPDLPKIMAPTLMLCGEYDTATPDTMGEACNLIKDAELNVIPNSGHLAYLDNNQAYVSAVQSFLNRLRL